MYKLISEVEELVQNAYDNYRTYISDVSEYLNKYEYTFDKSINNNMWSLLCNVTTNYNPNAIEVVREFEPINWLALSHNPNTNDILDFDNCKTTVYKNCSNMKKPEIKDFIEFTEFKINKYYPHAFEIDTIDLFKNKTKYEMIDKIKLWLNGNIDNTLPHYDGPTFNAYKICVYDYHAMKIAHSDLKDELHRHFTKE